MPDGRIKYNWGDDQVLIELGNRVEPRIKFLFWAEFVLTTGSATICMLNAFPVAGRGYLNLVIAICAAALYLLASYRLLSRLFSTEKLLLKPDRLEIINRTPFHFKTRTYEWGYMGPLHYVGLEQKTDHPLKGNCYDYFGFETQEKLIHRLHTEGNMYFNYGGFPVRFGKGLYSWHAEGIVNMMKLYVGSALVLGPEWDKMIQEQETDEA